MYQISQNAARSISIQSIKRQPFGKIPCRLPPEGNFCIKKGRTVEAIRPQRRARTDGGGISRIHFPHRHPFWEAGRLGTPVFVSRPIDCLRLTVYGTALPAKHPKGKWISQPPYGFAVKGRLARAQPTSCSLAPAGSSLSKWPRLMCRISCWMAFLRADGLRFSFTITM